MLLNENEISNFDKREADFYSQKTTTENKRAFFSTLCVGDVFSFLPNSFKYTFLGLETTLFESNYRYTDKKTVYSEEQDRNVFIYPI